MSKVVAFIPVRGGSKGIPLKNIKKFKGKPLVHWALEAATGSDTVDKVVVSTDHPDIEKTVKQYADQSKIVLFDRHPDTATDDASTESSILDYLSKANLSPQDTFVLLQATSPLTTSTHITEAIQLFEETKVHPVISVTEFYRFIWTSSGHALNYNPYSRPRRQDMSSDYFVENGAIYVNSVRNILKSKCRIGDGTGRSSCRLYVMPENTFIELDSPEDWRKAEELD